MAFDLEYIMTACDHRVHDELIVEATSGDIIVMSDASQYGSAVYGTGKFGYNVYSFLNRYGMSGTYIENSDGTITAILPIPATLASDPQLFAKLPNEYLRRRVPRYSATEHSTTLYFSDQLYLGEDPTYFGGSGYTPTTDAQEVWSIAYDPTTEGDVPVPANSLIIRRFDPRYELYLDYNTIESQCAYCQGTGVKNDLALNAVGKLRLVFDINKLAQTVIKAVMTPQGKNEQFPEYGTTISNMLGDKNITGYVVRDQIVRQLMRIKRIQDTILAQKPQFLTAREIFEDLIGVKVMDTDDPRVLNLSFYIKNSALETYKSKTVQVT